MNVGNFLREDHLMEFENKCRRFLIFLIVSIFIVLAIESPCFSSNGVLLMVKGKVTIDSRSDTYPAKTGLRLKPGVTVKSLGGTASILLSDGRMCLLKKGSSFTVPLDKKEGSQDLLVSRLMDTIKETAHSGRGPTIKGMVRGEKEIVLIYPFNSFIILDELRFEWKGMGGIEEIEVFLKSPSPAYRYSFKTAPGENRASLPKDALPLLPDTRYYWKVKGVEKTEDETYSSKLCWFAILGPGKKETFDSEMEKIDKISGLDESNRKFLKANLLTSYGLYHQAASILKQSFQQFPEDEGIKELLIGLLIKMKKFDEAEKY